MSTTRQHSVRAGTFGLKEAVALAETAHAGQVDLAGLPYIQHVLRVVAAVAAYGEETQMAAALHDTLEDTALTRDDLMRAGVPPDVLQAVDALTKRPGEAYDDAVRRASDHPIAKVVKLADNSDNSDEARLTRLEPTMAERLRQQYARARKILESTAVKEEG